MSSPIYTAGQYAKYWLSAKGPHSLHSPLLFELYRDAIVPSKYLVDEIEALRKRVYQDQRVVDVADFTSGISKKTTVGDVARRSISRPRFSNFLRLLCDQMKVKTVLETGTSLGINSLYLAKSESVLKVCSIEGSKIIHDLARKNIGERSKIDLMHGGVQDILEMALVKYQPELVFLDADHRGYVLKYCIEQIMNLSPRVKCIVVHDIYWSQDMTMMWQQTIENPEYTLTVDVFQAGLIFPRYPMEKQHFILKF